MLFYLKSNIMSYTSQISRNIVDEKSILILVAESRQIPVVCANCISYPRLQRCAMLAFREIHFRFHIVFLDTPYGGGCCWPTSTLKELFHPSQMLFVLLPPCSVTWYMFQIAGGNSGSALTSGT